MESVRQLEQLAEMLQRACLQHKQFVLNNASAGLRVCSLAAIMQLQQEVAELNLENKGE